jgi:hypothetical protein
VNPTDDQHLRQRLHEDLGALEISPAPVLRVTGRGQGIRVRRRALAAGTAILATLAVVAAAQFNGPAAAPSVTLNQPNPAAPGGVFASGTADGKQWALSVRNIAAAAGTHWCLPAVMFNGHDGDVLFTVPRGSPTFGNPAFLAYIPGFPGVGAIFTQPGPGETRLAGTSPDGRSITSRAVRVRACGTTFNLAGFAFARRHAPTEIATYGRFGLGDGLLVDAGSGSASLFPPTSPGVWSNLDKTRAHITASQAAHPIGAGTVDGQIWQIRASLGLYGQCYTATLRTAGHGRGQSSECVPVAAPPRTAALAAVPVSGAQAQLSGYAGLVSPRTAYGYASISDRTTRRVVPVRVAGRAYIALVVPAGCQVTWLSLFDASGHLFANVGKFTQPIPGLPEPPGSAGSS